MDETDGYTGSATLVIDGREFQVDVALRGYFDPIDGRYHWRGRIAASDELTAALGGRAASGTLTTGDGEGECSVSEPDPWGRYRVSGISTPPFRTALSAAPVACTLVPADLARQKIRWERLAEKALVDVTQTAVGMRLSFRPEPGAEQELRQLAAGETECCRWATWAVESQARQLVLEARSSGDGVAALHSMFGDLRPVPPASPR